MCPLGTLDQCAPAIIVDHTLLLSILNGMMSPFMYTLCIRCFCSLRNYDYEFALRMKYGLAIEMANDASVI